MNRYYVEIQTASVFKLIPVLSICDGGSIRHQYGGSIRHQFNPTAVSEHKRIVILYKQTNFAVLCNF